MVKLPGTLLLLASYAFLYPLMPWSLPVTLASIFYSPVSFRAHLVILIILGVLEDVWMIRPLGLTSLFLATIFVIRWLLHSYYRSYSLLWSMLMAAAGQIFLIWWFKEQGSAVTVFFQVVAVLAFYLVRQRWFDRDGIYVGA